MRGIARTKRIGHLGTLDPIATGVLPLVLEKATRLAQFYTRSDKIYEGVIHFGNSTDSYDADGAPPSPEISVSLDRAMVAHPEQLAWTRTGADVRRAKAAGQIAALAPWGVRLTKRGMWAALEIPSEQAAIEYEDRQQIMATMGVAPPEAVAAFLEKRPAEFLD